MKKYEIWGKFLKAKRSSQYRSAREFCQKVPVGISYPQYSRYEAGEQLPSLDHALRICRLLQIPLMEGLLEWSRAQVMEEEVLSKLEELIRQVRREKSGEWGSVLSVKPPQSSHLFAQDSRLNDMLVFNRSHLSLFQKDPLYRDIFTFINSFAVETPMKVSHLAKALHLTERKLKSMLLQLEELGVLKLDSHQEEVQSSKKVFYFPDDEDFFSMRNMNFQHNASSILERLEFDDLSQRKAFRSLITRELSSGQVRQVVEGLEKLLSQVTGLKEDAQSDTIYSLCILFGERFNLPPFEAHASPKVPAKQSLKLVKSVHPR